MLARFEGIKSRKLIVPPSRPRIVKRGSKIRYLLLFPFSGSRIPEAFRERVIVDLQLGDLQ